MVLVEFTETAQADLMHLDKPIAQPVLNKLRWLSVNFDVIPPEPWKGPWVRIFKLRIGDYQLVYTCDPKKTKIRFIRHRREIYKLS